MKDGPSLADLFAADVGRWSRFFGLAGRHRKKTDATAALFRQQIMQAKRFVLDDDFCRWATTIASTTKAEKLLYRLQYATIPYDLTWIEFDARLRVRVMRDIHRAGEQFFDYDEVPERMGVLLHRIDRTRWLCNIVSSPTIDGTPVIANLIAFLVSLDGSMVEKFDGCSPLDLSDPMLDIGLKAQYARILTKAVLWGYGDLDGKMDKATGGMVLDGSTGTLFELRVPGILESHGGAAFSRMFEVFRSRVEQADGKKAKLRAFNHLTDAMYAEMREFTGFMRWVVTVLSMLNEVPIRSGRVHIGNDYRARLGGRRPLDHHVITLRVPRSNPARYIERKISNRHHKNRAHDVMEHWRVYVSEDPCRREDHDWHYADDHSYRQCTVCNSGSTLIPQHVRGDPSLGWVEKSYVVKKARSIDD